MRRSEFIFFLAIDRKWMNKDQANRLISIAEERGLIRQEEGIILPVFDPTEITIPLGFRPSSEIFAQPDPVQEVLERVAATTQKEVSVIAAEMNDLIQQGFDGNLRAEAAVVIVARRYNTQFEDLITELQANLRQKKE